MAWVAGRAQSDPVAAPGATVVCGNARFTVLTDRLVRMEWAADGRFEDRASLAVINRNLPVPSFKADRKGDGVTIKTSGLTLSYKGGKFAPDNLSVSFKLGGKTVTWHPGDAATGNLKGTTRTLDGCKGFDRLSHREKELEDGILSRDGWAVIDESSRHLFEKDSSDWGEWVCERPEGECIDWYIFAYGHDYLAALNDFTKIAGGIPLPPKYVFGYWLHWLPISGVSDWRSFILPAIALGWNSAGSIARLVRSTLADTLEDDYIDTARAKGLSETAVIWRHALRNTMLPTVTMMALQLSGLLSGAVITETVFSINGIGRLAVQAINGRDIPLLQGTVLFATALVIFGNLIADLLYKVLDPRTRREVKE